jgi:hypothetical protein
MVGSWVKGRQEVRGVGGKGEGEGEGEGDSEGEHGKAGPTLAPKKHKQLPVSMADRVAARSRNKESSSFIRLSTIFFLEAETWPAQASGVGERGWGCSCECERGNHGTKATHVRAGYILAVQEVHTCP